MNPWLGRLLIILALFAAGYGLAFWIGYGDWAWGVGGLSAVVGSLIVQTFIWKPKRPN